MRIEVKRPLLHRGRRVPVGEVIDVSMQHARTLVAVKIAAYAPAEAAPAKAPPKRTYKRRDMKAEKSEPVPTEQAETETKVESEQQ